MQEKLGLHLHLVFIFLNETQTNSPSLQSTLALFNKINSITILTGCSGWTPAPTVFINGTGTGASATATVAAAEVEIHEQIKYQQSH